MSSLHLIEHILISTSFSVLLDKDINEIRNHSRSLIRLTYRNSFPPLSPYNMSSDAGWGCMLRSAQMIMAQALQRHMLGKEWRLPSPDTCRANSDYYTIVRWFTDYPGPACIYSLHHLVQCGMLYDKLPGEWYGPSAAALVLRDLARLHRRKYRGPMEIYVTSGDTIYITEAEKTFINSTIVTTIEDEPVMNCQSGDELESKRNTDRIGRKQINLRDQDVPPPHEISLGLQGEDNVDYSIATPTPTALPEKFQIDLPTISMESYPHLNTRSLMVDLKPSSSASTSFHDPLLNPPPNKVNDWPCGLMVLVPLRLGLDSVNPMYFEELKEIFHNEYCIGIIGGRPNHAIYFAGYRGNSMLGLDPHTVYANPSLRDPFPSDEHIEQMHQSSLEELPFRNLDPSLAIGFYFRNRDEFGSFCQQRRLYEERMMSRKRESKDDMSYQSTPYAPLFTVQYAAADLEYYGQGQSDSELNSDIEDEYVFV